MLTRYHLISICIAHVWINPQLPYFRVWGEVSSYFKNKILYSHMNFLISSCFNFYHLTQPVYLLFLGWYSCQHFHKKIISFIGKIKSILYKLSCNPGGSTTRKQYVAHRLLCYHSECTESVEYSISNNLFH